MSKKVLTVCVLILSVFSVNYSSLSGKTEVISSDSNVNPAMDYYFTWFYKILKSDAPKPDYEVFKEALSGFFNLKARNQLKKNMLTIIDFSVTSRQERMWIVDMNEMKVVQYSLVAHGKNSGEEYASYFSNNPSSYQSSLGFYLTDGIYYGKHGMSLYLDGVESGLNDKARDRAIVIHAANYVSKDFIRNYGRLGRSYGCPSIPAENHEKIITMLAGRSCIYIYHPDETYHKCSQMFTWETTLAGMHNFLIEVSGNFDFYPESLIAENY